MDRKEAIETIRRYMPRVGDSQCDFETALRELIPELAESEDKKIAEELIKALRGISTGLQYAIFLTEEKKQRWLAWLEKQKEPKHAPDDLQKSFEAGQMSIVDNPEQYGLCKKTEWGEEDEKTMQDLIDLLWIIQGSSNIKPGTASKYTQWLKSLRPSWKPSEEQMKAPKGVPPIEAIQK